MSSEVSGPHRGSCKEAPGEGQWLYFPCAPVVALVPQMCHCHSLLESFFQPTHFLGGAPPVPLSPAGGRGAIRAGSD